MTATVLNGPRDIRLEDRDDPQAIPRRRGRFMALQSGSKPTAHQNDNAAWPLPPSI